MTRNYARGQNIIAGGFQTNYHDQGSGKPLIMLHGSGAGVSAWESWSNVIDNFSKHRRVIAPDIVGFGLTQRPSTLELNFNVWKNHLIGILDALKIECADVVGNSFGGVLAMATALSHPNRIGKLVLMGTPAGEFSRNRTGNTLALKPTLEGMRELLLGFPFDKSVVTDEMVRNRFEMFQHTNTTEAYRSLLRAKDSESSTTIVRGISSTALSKISQPVLALHGREDEIIPSSCSFEILRHCPQAQLHIFGNCGHWVQIERKREFIDMSLNFLG